MNEVNREKLIVLVVSDDLNKVMTALLTTIEAVEKGMDASMFFMSCGIKAMKRNAKLRLKGILMPFTPIAVRKMKAAGIDPMDVQIEKVKYLGVQLYVCRTCTEILKLDETSLTAGVTIVDRSKYIDFLREADYHIEIC